MEIPEPPEHFTGEALAEWNRIAVELKELGLLSKVDRAALAGYCDAWADWVDASEKVLAHGKLVKTGEKLKYDADGKIVERSGGNTIENPFYSIKKRAAEMMHKFLTEFGMTPASRTRISSPNKNGGGAKPKTSWGTFGK